MYVSFESGEQVAAALVKADPGAKAWLLLVADCHAAALDELFAACRSRAIAVCGGLFPGLIQGTRALDQGIVALPLPPGSVSAVAILGREGPRWTSDLPDAQSTHPSSIMLVDASAPHVDGLLDDIYDRYGNRMRHIGAGAGYRDLRAEPSIFSSEGLQANAALLVALPRRLSLGVRHGWRRIAGPYVASRTDGNRIIELNWEPAGRFYRQQVAMQEPALADKPIFPDLNSKYPLGVAKEGSEDIIRDPIRTTRDDELEVLSDVPENALMYLASGDRDSLFEAAREAVADCGAPSGIASCFISDCYSRALMLGQAFERELEIVTHALAEHTDVVPEGVMAMGEVAANGTQKLELFNKTIVVGLTCHEP